MKNKKYKYDVRFSLKTDTYKWRYQERVTANNEEDAKNIIKEKVKNATNIRVKKAQDYICWTYRQIKNDKGEYFLQKNYYCGYLNLHQLGKAAKLDEKIENAKRFENQTQLKEELKHINCKVAEFKIEKIEGMSEYE